MTAELENIQHSLDKLGATDTGEWCHRSDSIFKLSQLVSESDPILSRGQVTKAYDLIKRYRFSKAAADRFKRLASLPPQRSGRVRSSVSPSHIRNSMVTSHSCHEMSQLDKQDEFTAAPLSPIDDSSVHSRSSSITLKDSLNTSMRRSSLDSVTMSTSDLHSTMAPYPQWKVDIVQYASDEWRGNTDKADAIRKVWYHTQFFQK